MPPDTKISMLTTPIKTLGRILIFTSDDIYEIPCMSKYKKGYIEGHKLGYISLLNLFTLRTNNINSLPQRMSKK